MISSTSAADDIGAFLFFQSSRNPVARIKISGTVPDFSQRQFKHISERLPVILAATRVNLAIPVNNHGTPWPAARNWRRINGGAEFPVCIRTEYIRAGGLIFFLVKILRTNKVGILRRSDVLRVNIQIWLYNPCKVCAGISGKLCNLRYLMFIMTEHKEFESTLSRFPPLLYVS